MALRASARLCIADGAASEKIPPAVAPVSEAQTEMVQGDPENALDTAWEAKRESGRAASNLQPLEDFAAAVRSRRMEEGRVFAVVHAFAGPQRDGDIESWLARQ